MMLNTIRRHNGVGPDAGPGARPKASLDIVVPILRSGILAHELCQRGGQAEVAAVFERSLYLRFGDMFVCVGAPSVGDGPLTLISDLGGSRPLTSLGLRVGQPAAVSGRCIVIGGVVELTFDCCLPWHQPPWPRLHSIRELNDLVRVIVRRMSCEAPHEGLARVFCLRDAGASETPLARIARSRLARFESWLRGALEKDVPTDTSPAPVLDLVGLGPGLTPSGDDFLVGAIALLDALSEREARAALVRAIAAIPRGRTSALSECLLKTAAAGHLGADLCCAVSAVVSGRPDPAVAAIRTIGHGSGWDMLAGALTTLRVVATLDVNSGPRRTV